MFSKDASLQEQISKLVEFRVDFEVWFGESNILSYYDFSGLEYFHTYTPEGVYLKAELSSNLKNYT